MPRHTRRSLIAVSTCLMLGNIPFAHAASFDCDKARTGVEKAICSDPKLSEYDERIAAAFKRALGEWNGAIRNYVRDDQRRWLAEIRRIDAPAESEIEPLCVAGDLPCLRRELQLRMDTLESSGYRNSGVYQRSDGGGNLLVTAIRNADIRLRVYDRKTSKILGSAEDEAATQRSGLPQLQRDTFQWHGPDTFLVEAADDTGTPAADGCTLTVQFTERAATVLQQGGCNGARLEGTYLRDLSDLPSNHESSVD